MPYPVGNAARSCGATWTKACQCSRAVKQSQRSLDCFYMGVAEVMNKVRWNMYHDRGQPHHFFMTRKVTLSDVTAKVIICKGSIIMITVSSVIIIMIIRGSVVINSLT